MTIKCIVTDDEPLARKGLQGYIEQIGFLELAGTCENAIELNTLLKTTSADLLFLDIEMPYVTGIDFLRTNKHSPKVIFTTAYEQYALQGYELDVLDYLLKPISFERFLMAANKAHEYFNRTDHQMEYLFVKVDQRLEKVEIAEILFIEALENYMAIHLTHKKILVHSTLKSLAATLPQQSFLQPHKSYLVSIAQIEAVEGNMIIIGPHRIPISKYLKEEVLVRLVNSRNANRR